MRRDDQVFQPPPPPPTMVDRLANPWSSVEEEQWFHDGTECFDSGKFWHAHEAWEDLWNALKRRSAPPEEIRLVQGLIQTAALLFHYERRNTNGVLKQWEKLEPKLHGWDTAWGIDIASHLQSLAGYHRDAGQWTLVAADHQLPRA